MEGMEELHLDFDKSLRKKIAERLEKDNPQNINELIVFAEKVMARFSPVEVGTDELPDVNSIRDYFDVYGDFRIGNTFDIENFCNMMEEYHYTCVKLISNSLGNLFYDMQLDGL